MFFDRPTLVRSARVAPLAGAFLLLAAAPPPLRPPSDDVLREATALVEAMKTSERGPYRRIAWFCNDGTVQPPVPYACRDRGGGRQHAEYSTDRERLAELGFPVGTIFAALPWTEVWEPERRHLRLRQLVLERYLVAADDGWVLRQARWYRGRVQIEDEESAGRDLLIQLLARTDWVRSDFLLAREATRAIPHHGGEDRTRLLRRLAEDIARIDSAFQPLRIKIHTSPEPKDAASVRDWTSAARKRGVADDVVAQADSLITVIESLYSDQGRAERLAQYRRRLARSKSDRELATRLAALEGAPLAARLPQLAGLLRDLRRTVEASTDGERNVRLLDLSLELESLLVADAFTRLSAESASRSDLAELARVLADGTYGVGLLSEGERDEVTTALAALPPDGSTSSEAWLEAARVLRRTGTWSLGAVRWTFAEPLAQWGALEPKATRFPDDLLRSSPALALGEVTRAFVADAESVAGTPHRVFETAAPNLVGLNPGVAVGRLRVADPDEVGNVARDEIVVLRRTVSELSPVAGILTLSEGNLLSHIQILARNLGIPNALLSRDAGARVTAADGDSVLLAVSSAGSVVLERWADVPDSLRNALTRRAEVPTVKVSAPVPDLDARDLIVLKDLHGELSGRVVGPKAANLGDLARAFPGHVAPAIAIPFGIFAAHVADGEDSPLAILRARFDENRRGELDDAGLAAAVETARAAIAATPLEPGFREKLLARMKTEFGPGAGVFVRSDTNVEDLPGFTGAGLNETVPHVVGEQAQLDAIPRVWASPFRERAMSWRANLLTRPEDVYTSVLLMKSVPAEKSGVLVTTDLLERRGGLTVAAAWGVGGAVDNESAETIVLRPDGRRVLAGEAKAPYRRQLRDSGGIEWVPAPAGRVLTDAECDLLRAMVDRIGETFAAAEGAGGRPRPWDVEFGFLNGELTLFQIRPLVERGQETADTVVESRVGPVAVAGGNVDLDGGVALRRPEVAP